MCKQISRHQLNSEHRIMFNRYPKLEIERSIKSYRPSTRRITIVKKICWLLFIPLLSIHLDAPAMANEIHSDSAILSGLDRHRGRSLATQPRFTRSPQLSQSILPAPASTAPDLNLLSKVAGVFWQSDRYEKVSKQIFLSIQRMERCRDLRLLV